MAALQNSVAILYLAAMALLAVYGWHRLWLLARFRWAGTESDKTEPVAASQLPVVTVQLPVFNERTVAARLIQAAGRIEYPRERLEIQVLDDSTDETKEIVEREVERLARRGLDARIVRRSQRTGFKAGALARGLESARGELVCIFDADFTPQPDFLRQLVPVFRDPGVGMVQARWGHHNREQSLLTRAQSTLLDGHFVIEHTVRHALGLFFNFNGTAGIWRRQAIVDAGGWQHDTLTEDLDLSYRAQLAGWRFVYAPHVVAPAELPSDIAAFQSQQRRWAMGSVQVARKLLPRLACARQPLRIKREAFAHLSANIGYPLVLAIALLLPLTLAREALLPLRLSLALFGACSLSVFLFYERCERALGRPLGARIVDGLSAVLLGLGMCARQTLAVFAGLRRDPGSFARTPKRGDAPKGQRYRSQLHGMPGGELLLAAWTLGGIVYAARLGHWGAVLFLTLFFCGFAWVGVLTLEHWLRSRSSSLPERRTCDQASTQPLSTR